MTDWKPIETAPHNVFVLVACPSGYVTTPWCFFTAIYSAGYHDRWDNPANDGLDVQPLWWTELPDDVPEVDVGVWWKPKNPSSQIVQFRAFANHEDNAGTGDLEVEFVGGGVYRYMRVPNPLIQMFRCAQSSGSYLAQHIKGHYEYKKVK